MTRPVLGAIAALWMFTCAAPIALAQDEAANEVVVTAEKREVNEARTPHVVLMRRADNLITEVKVVCDTRDPTQRVNELKATLRNMIKGSNGQIELGVGDVLVGRFDATMLDRVITPQLRADTSEATVIIKTHIVAGDTFDTAAARITDFIAKTPKVGRSEILREKEWNLTIIKPEQYRGAIIAKVAEDARGISAAFGPGYGVSVDGLQQPVDWYQSGALDLALFIPYKLVVQPPQR
jgi:type IV pilus biogenesis protein CpaD/CtpE